MTRRVSSGAEPATATFMRVTAGGPLLTVNCRVVSVPDSGGVGCCRWLIGPGMLRQPAPQFPVGVFSCVGDDPGFGV